ncbi:hypothetical protein P152DRAFT_242021 [Eremomyces bilateralis CBS 781.70]|uniref:Zn(2)-C6 fungal-type domain-containing protein n=1 Tax=Eremomyces bilateralis CBS 781.70 TaxID=1392243 RepID=A0A6G1GAN8_9PEZI|nr:uncharacterized protein P152DRAFT_242021 [Eremomyces bilateralis CBS 781.70]KAF1815006.1 hypothetical protein P152DRAFT_242021 [Eremomyces bilateralis CBS 781.70]
MFQSGFIFEAPNTIGKPTTASGKPKKTRASCDACSKSKIKCGQQRPACTRCSKLSIACNYSPSRRIGKPAGSGKKKQIHNHPPSSAAPTTGHSHTSSIASDASARSNHASQSLFNVLPAQLGVLPDTPSSDLEDKTPRPGYFTNAESYFYEANIKSSSPSPSETSSSHSSYKFPIPEHPLLLSADPTMAPPAMLESDLSMDSDFSLSDAFSDFSASEASTFAIGDGFSTPASACSSQPSNNMEFSEGIQQHFTKLSMLEKIQPSGQSSQHCMSQALTILFSLHDPSSIPASAGGFRTIDSILDSNRQALDSLTSILKCLCQKDPEGSLLVALIITKLLNSYKCITQTHQASPSAACNCPDTTRCRSSSLHSQGRSPTRTPVKLGSYALDEQDEECIKMQLVLSQLKRLEKLIERFMEILNGPGQDLSPALKTFVTGTFDEVLSEARRRSDCNMRV